MEIKQEIEKMVFLLEKANSSYRTGNTDWFDQNGLIPPTDKEYDDLLDKLAIIDQENEFLKQIGYSIPDVGRKQKLPVQMLSADKTKTLDDVRRWMSRNNIPPDVFVILTPKLDGISLLVSETILPEQEYKLAWTRGDGAEGQMSDVHFAAIEAKDNVANSFYSRGEALISKMNWKKHFEGRINPHNNKPYLNSRNTVAGMFNAEVPRMELMYVDFIRFGMNNFDGTILDKSKQLELVNQLNPVPIPTRSVKLRDLNENLLNSLFEKWSIEYDIDGIIIDIDNADLRKHLGTHVSGKYPSYMIAYKSDNEEVKETVVKDVILQISKTGLAKPVVLVEPVELDGATVRRATGNNMKFIIDNKIAAGATIKLKRSGFVVPKIIEIVTTGDATTITGKPCPICNSELVWGEPNDSGEITDMECSNPDCDGRQYKRLLSFFKTLDVENVGPGVIEIIYSAGYTRVGDVIELTEDGFEKLEGFGKRKAEIVYNAIAAKLVNIPISKIQHASGYFSGLGSRKLKIVNDWIRESNKNFINRAEILQLDGFAAKSADVYLNGIPTFWEWIQHIGLNENIDLNDGIIKKEKIMENTLNGKACVFTGFRDADMEDEIIDHGGCMKSGISKNADILVMKVKGSGTSKERKAQDLGLEITDINEFKEKYLT